MSFIIRSANGQRSLKKINSNKTEDRKPLRDELVEALRGLVIKFEVRIADIIQQEDELAEKQQEDKKQEPGDEDPTGFKINKDNIVTNLRTKVVIDDPSSVQGSPMTNGYKNEPEPEDKLPIKTSVSGTTPAPATKAAVSAPEPVQQAAPIRPKLNGVSASTADVKPTANGCTSEPEKPKPKVTDFLPASLQRPKTASNIVPIIKKSEPQAASQANLVEADLSPAVPTSPVIVNPPVVTASGPEKAKAKPALRSSELVKGTLKIGGIIETVIVGFGGSTEEPIYYVPYDSDKFVQIGQLIQEQGPAIETQPLVNSIDVGDIVFAKSKEDNVWYRSIVQKVNPEDVHVFFFDWGLDETLELTRVRRLYILELGLSSNPACAVKVDIVNKPGPLVDRFVDQGERLNVKVDAYDEATDTYSITILDDQ